MADFIKTGYWVSAPSGRAGWYNLDRRVADLSGSRPTIDLAPGGTVLEAQDQEDYVIDFAALTNDPIEVAAEKYSFQIDMLVQHGFTLNNNNGDNVSPYNHVLYIRGKNSNGQIIGEIDTLMADYFGFISPTGGIVLDIQQPMYIRINIPKGGLSSEGIPWSVSWGLKNNKRINYYGEAENVDPYSPYGDRQDPNSISTGNYNVNVPAYGFDPNINPPYGGYAYPGGVYNTTSTTARVAQADGFLGFQKPTSATGGLNNQSSVGQTSFTINTSGNVATLNLTPFIADFNTLNEGNRINNPYVNKGVRILNLKISPFS